MDPNFSILFIGGSSGVGKSFLSRKLSGFFQVPVLELDNLKVSLQAYTKRNEHRDLFLLIDNPNFRTNLNGDEYVELQSRISIELTSALNPILEKHLHQEDKLIVEGDNLMPSLLPDIGNRGISGVMLYDERNAIMSKQIARGRVGNPPSYAGVDSDYSFCFGQRLKSEAAAAGWPVLKASPGSTLVARTVCELFGNE